MKLKPFTATEGFISEKQITLYPEFIKIKLDKFERETQVGFEYCWKKYRYLYFSNSTQGTSVLYCAGELIYDASRTKWESASVELHEAARQLSVHLRKNVI